MNQKKTFDPDDSIKEMSIFIMRRKAGFAAVTVRINVAAAFEEAARQLHAVTRKTPRLNRLGTPVKNRNKSHAP